MRIIQLNATPVWHQKPFSIEIPENAWRILVWYHNGYTKPWWKKTDGQHLFKRWFWLKPPFRFKSIGNKHSPGLKIWIFRNWFSLPQKALIPFNASQLELNTTVLELPQLRIDPKRVHTPERNEFDLSPLGLEFNPLDIRHSRPTFLSIDLSIMPPTEPELKTT